MSSKYWESALKTRESLETGILFLGHCLSGLFKKVSIEWVEHLKILCVKWHKKAAKVECGEIKIRRICLLRVRVCNI